MLTLRTLTASLLLTIVMASIGSGLLLDTLYTKLYSEDNTNTDLTPSQLEAIGKPLSALLQKLDDTEEFIRAWQEEEAFLFLEILDKDDIRMPTELFEELEQSGHITLRSTLSLSHYSFLKKRNKYVVLRSPITYTKKKNTSLPLIFTILFYALLMLVVFAWLFPLIRRLKRMQMSAKRLGEGDLSARIAPSAVSHIKDIEREFNRMAQRIEELVSDISLISSAISHEMRAPLAKLQFGLDALREESDIETRQLYHDRLDNVIVDMTHLTETLLQYARLDKNVASLTKDELDLVAVSQRLVSLAEQTPNRDDGSRIPSIDIHINKAHANYSVNGNAFYMHLLIENLLSNAMKYGDGKIGIHLDRSDDKTVFIIEDNGPGIDSSFKQDIFKPFVRWGKIKKERDAHDENQKGYGLGMALVKRIVDVHDADIKIVKSSTLGGAKITLLFH